MAEGRRAYDGRMGAGEHVIPDALRLAIVSGRLALALTHSGLTRAELAERSGISQTAISRYVRGERMVSTPALVAFCSALGVSSDWMLGLDPRTRQMFESIEERQRSTAAADG